MNDTVKSLVHHKSYFLRVLGTYSLLLMHDADTILLELLSIDGVPAYQRSLAIWVTGVRKEKALRHSLIGIVKSSSARPHRISAINALAHIGNICSEGINETSVLDLIDVYLNSMDPKIYSGLHALLLSEHDFPAHAYVSQALVERCEIGEEMTDQSREILSRALHLSFLCTMQREDPLFRKEMGEVQHHDKEREKVERLAFYIRKVVNLTRSTREELKADLQESGRHLIPLLCSPEINRSFQAKAGMEKMIKPLTAYILDSRPGIRTIVMKELQDIPSPVIYEYYRALCLRKLRGLPDTPGLLMTVLGSLSRIDSEALDVLLSLVPDTREEYLTPLLDAIQNAASASEWVKNRIISELIVLLKAGLDSDKIAQELVTKVLGLGVSPDIIGFLLEVSTNGENYSPGMRKRAIKILLKYNRPEFPCYEEISQCIKKLSQDGGTQELQQFIFKEIKESPLTDNVSFLKEGIFDTKEDVRKGAIRSYFDLVKSSRIKQDEARAFIISLISPSSSAMPDIKIQVVDFIKTIPAHDDELREKIFLLLFNEVKELRNHSLELITQWLGSPRDDAEGIRLLKALLDILKNPDFPHEDIYTKIAKHVSNGIGESTPLFEKNMKGIFLGIQDGLCAPLTHYQVKILCEILDNAGSGKNRNAQIQANWIMENLLKRKDVAPAVSLYILAFLINKEGKIMQFFPRLLEFLTLNDPYARKVSLEILAGANVFSHRWSITEKLNAIASKGPKEILDYIRWEASLNRDLLGVLLRALRDPATDNDSILLIMAIIRRLECARGELKAIFGYQDARFGDTVRERVLESVAFLLYPPFNEEEMGIIRELQRIASDQSIGPNYRLSSLLALVEIGVDEFYDFFLQIAQGEGDRHDIRRLALQGLNTIRNPEIVPFYLSCLTNPRYGAVQRETIVEGLRESGRAVIIEPLLKIVFGDERESLQERARNALTVSGYGQAVEIRGLYHGIQSKRDEMKTLQENIVGTKSRISSIEAEIQQIKGEVKRVSSIIADEEGHLREEKKRVQGEIERWDGQKIKIENRLRELAPEWPNEKKIPRELKEPFLIAKEEYIQFTQKYDQLREEISQGPIELETRIQEYREMLRGIVDREELCAEDMAAFREEMQKHEGKMSTLLQEINRDEDAYRTLGQQFKEDLKRIEEENLAKVRAYRQNRVAEWKYRWDYYSVLSKMAAAREQKGEEPAREQRIAVQVQKTAAQAPEIRGLGFETGGQKPAIAGQTPHPAGQERQPARQIPHPAGQERQPARQIPHPAGQEREPAPQIPHPAGQERQPARQIPHPAGQEREPAPQTPQTVRQTPDSARRIGAVRQRPGMLSLKTDGGGQASETGEQKPAAGSQLSGAPKQGIESQGPSLPGQAPGASTQTPGAVQKPEQGPKKPGPKIQRLKIKE